MNRYAKTLPTGFSPPRGLHCFPLLPPWGIRIPTRVFPGEPAAGLVYGYTPRRSGRETSDAGESPPDSDTPCASDLKTLKGVPP